MTFSTQRLKPAVLALLLAAAGIGAKDARAEDLVLKEAASMKGAVLWLSSGAPGLVLAVVRGEEALVLGFGETRARQQERAEWPLHPAHWPRSPRRWPATCSPAWRPTAP